MSLIPVPGAKDSAPKDKVKGHGDGSLEVDWSSLKLGQDVGHERLLCNGGYDVTTYFSIAEAKDMTDDSAPIAIAHGSADHELDLESVLQGTLVYRFATKDNLEKFKEHPEIFMSQYGGYCATACATGNTDSRPLKKSKNGSSTDDSEGSSSDSLKGHLVPADPLCYWVKNDGLLGKLYLFADTDAKDLFLAEPDLMIAEADANWSKLAQHKYSVGICRNLSTDVTVSDEDAAEAAKKTE